MDTQSTVSQSAFDPGADPRWALVKADAYDLLIGGRLVPAADGAVFPAICPRDNAAGGEDRPGGDR